MRNLLLRTLLIMPMLMAASTDVEANPRSAETAPSFSQQVQPIFDANCVACHQVGAAQQGLVLESGAAYAAIVGKRSKEAAMSLVTPGSTDTSYLFQKINGSQLKAGGQGARMPLGGKLEPADIETIRQWILVGTQNN